MPNRTSPRHPDFDYRTPAAYFVTVCTHDRRCLFGTVRRGWLYLNDIGIIVTEEPRCRPLSAWRACRRYIEQHPAQWPRERKHPGRCSE